MNFTTRPQHVQRKHTRNMMLTVLCTKISMSLSHLILFMNEDLTTKSCGHDSTWY